MVHSRSVRLDDARTGRGAQQCHAARRAGIRSRADAHVGFVLHLAEYFSLAGCGQDGIDPEVFLLTLAVTESYSQRCNGVKPTACLTTMQTICGKRSEFSSELENAMAAYRHKIFIERLGWPLPVENGQERDQFDHPDTLYVVARDSEGDICGCARLLPTTEPYLLSEIFPELMGSAPIPKSHEVWELSRFAAAAIDGNATVDTAANTRNLLAAAVRNAMKQGAKRLITVSPLGIERLLHRMGVHAHRAGPPMLADGKPIFACWIEIDEQTMNALGIEGTRALPHDDSVNFFHGGHKMLSIVRH